MQPENQDSSPNQTSFLSQIPAELLSSLLTAVLLISGFLAYQTFVATTPTPTPQALQIPPPATPTATLTPTATPTSTPTNTPTATSTPTPTLTPTPTVTPTPTPIIISWQELGQLDTFEITTFTIIEDTQPRWWILPDGRVIVRITGAVQYGLDVSQISARTTVDGTKATLTLPKAQVTSVELLRADVYDTAWTFNTNVSVSIIEEANVQIRNWAAGQEDLFIVAEKLGKNQIEDFLLSLGFEEVEITFE
ncbi:MAG: DUF4230 domain-containing protein [Chloroflexota bacterium]